MLTKKQNEVFEYIKTYLTDNGYSPTQKEIKEHFGLKSFGSVQRYLRYLQEYGLIENSWNARRGIQVNKDSNSSKNQTNNKFTSLPFVGDIAAGIPIEAIENCTEHLDVPSHLFNREKVNFCLQVKGDSMIDAGIIDKDVVIIEKSDNPKNGQIVAAIIEGEATLKTFKKTRNNIQLIPANRNYETILLSNGDLQIAGVLVGLIRTY
ncbi:MAG: repressor LexA [Halobacteriovoraceae bacterium]|nr:repressor LexA [Halobacteriovoraceae bacterium]|tara:strand:- start:451 stop:1071 length:621 start_codon:yes stop_codon:yes gene_type:complete